MKNKIMKNYKNTLMVVAGGTGGHIYPSLSLIKEINDFKIIIVTDQRGKEYFKNFLHKNNLNYKIFIHKVTSPTNKPLINKFISLFEIFLSFLKSLKLVFIHKPDVVIGFGGYPTVAPILAAKISKVNTIIHEQNAIIGRGNNLLSKISDVVALSFPKTKTTKKIKNSIFSGNPVRQEFYDIGDDRYSKKISSKTIIILIYGGSLGASYFSNEICSILCSLPERFKKKIKIIQQVRKEEKKLVQKNYKNHRIDSEVACFYPNIYEKFKYAHLIITRSGGSTVAEILASSIPAIFIPLPNALDNHQYENTKIFQNHNCGWVINQINNTKKDFEKLIKELLKNPNQLIQVRERIKQLSDRLSKSRNNKTPTQFLSDLIIKQVNTSKKEFNQSC